MNMRMIAAGVAAPVLAVTMMSGAHAAVGDRVTANPSDSTPASGETFRVSGKLTHEGAAYAGKSVQIQTLRGGVWQDITGARVTTRSDGTYSVRVILGSTGERTMRAIARVPGHDPRDRFVVTVH